MSKLAVLGGEPVRTKQWPDWPDVREADVEAVAKTVASGHWWQYAGEQTLNIEREFAAYQEARHGIAVNSGTTALHVALAALGVGPGDEVIVPAYTFLASATSVLLSNAVPIFADVQPDTLNIDPESVAAVITERTRAIIPVHLAGLPADMKRLRELAGPGRIALLEDAAQAHGARWQGHKVGAIGEAGTFSFQASKNLCSGEGGMILTDDDELAARAAGLRDCGRVRGRPFYEHHTLGYNFRMTEMQSALLRSRLGQLEAETEKRFENGRRLTRELAALPGLEPIDPEPSQGDRRAYHIYIVRLHSESLGGIARDQFMEALQAEGVPCFGGYGGPVYRNPVFLAHRFRPRGCPLSCGHYPASVDYEQTSCPVTEELCGDLIWISHNLLLGSDQDMRDIVGAFAKVVAAHRELL